ncbi:helix-turn-helix domain-containing protein, partial [Klebsiella pneumoniae]|nr:helix-turn-helix domain-containing protein [Klebsiella pneumoniae]
GEITSLLHFNNKCFASNEYFSKLYEVSEVQISRLIKQLIDKNYITSEVEKTNNGSRRIIKIALNIFDNTPINKNDK